MTAPARRKSSKKSREGRSAKNLFFKKKAFQTLIKCENCKEIKVIHQVCKKCLTYKKIDFN